MNQAMPKRKILSVSRNTMLVFLAAAPQYKQWKQDNPGRDAKHLFPGIDVLAVRADSTPYKQARPFSPDEVLQHLILLTERQLISRQVSREVQEGKEYHFMLTQKGETAYDRLATAKFVGHLLLPFLLHKENEGWTAFVVLAFLARPKSDALTDQQVARMTGLTLSSVQTGRKMAAAGFDAFSDKGVVTFPPARYVTVRPEGVGADTARALHRDQWVLDGEDLTDFVAALAAAPTPPAAAPALEVKKTEVELTPVAPDAVPVESDVTAVVPLQGQRNATRITLWLSGDEYEALAESINGSTVEDYLKAFVQQTAARALERREKQAQLQRLLADQARLKAEAEALQAELNTL